MKNTIEELRRSHECGLMLSAQDIDSLFEEIDRLEKGDFTEEEFQNLCHSVIVREGRSRFEQGCVSYQNQLFGPSHDRVHNDPEFPEAF